MGALSVFVIVFREVLEIALTLILVAVATASIPNRKRWIWLGMVLGGIGSMIVAQTTDAISESLEGLGQEIFQGTVLTLSAALIIYTVVWMKGHAKDVAAAIKKTSSLVIEGDKHMFSLSLIIAFTVLRDGAEIVLLSQGLTAAGLGIAEFAGGAISAVVLGTLIGWAIYRGILSFKAYKIFSFLSIILIFLAAGLASQAAGFFTSAGIIPTIKSRLWDTSWIVSDASYFGQFLHILVGYSARPSAMQAIWYFTTLIVAFCFVYGVPYMMKKVKTHIAIIALVGLANLTTTTTPALAVDKVYSPYVEEGELELEARGTWNFDDRDEEDNIIKTKLGLGYGFTDRLAAEAYAVFFKEDGESTDVTSVNIEARYMLTQPGEYWLDAGLYAEYEYATQSHASDAVEAKLLLEHNSTALRTLANVIFEREVGSNSEDEIEWEIALNSRYRLDQAFEPGVEWQSEFGELGDEGSFDEQEHFVGPALFGKILGNWKYEAAWLFGVSDAAPDNVFRWVLEYEF